MTGSVYKVRDPKTGRFKLGGGYPRWSKTGKVWTTVGHLRQHLGRITETRHPIDPAWEVLEFTVTTTPGAIKTMGDFMARR